MEVYSGKRQQNRPDWGEQWDTESWYFLRRLTDGQKEESELSHLPSEGPCLVVGVGGGYHSQILSRHLSYVIGFDIARPEHRLDLSPNCERLVADAERLPFRDSSFTAIVCLGTLHHLPNPAVGVREMNRVSAENAALVMHEPGLINPIALISRKVLPTQIHTPGERPFMLDELRDLVTQFYEIYEETEFHLVSLALPVFFKKARLPIKVKHVLILATVRLEDSILRLKLFRGLASSFFFLAQKKRRQQAEIGSYPA